MNKQTREGGEMYKARFEVSKVDPANAYYYFARERERE